MHLMLSAATRGLTSGAIESLASIEKGNVKGGIVRNERRVADEGRNSSAISANSGLSAKNSTVSPCTAAASAGIPRCGHAER